MLVTTEECTGCIEVDMYVCMYVCMVIDPPVDNRLSPLSLSFIYTRSIAWVALNNCYEADPPSVH